MIETVAEKGYSITFAEEQKTFCLSLHFNRSNNYILVNGVKIYRCKAKQSERNAAPLCLSSVSKYFSVDDMKKTGICFPHVLIREFMTIYDCHYLLLWCKTYIYKKIYWWNNNIKTENIYLLMSQIKIEGFDFGNVLLDEKSYETILIYNVLYKTLIGSKPMRIIYNMVDSVIRDYGGTKYLVLFGSERHDAI